MGVKKQREASLMQGLAYANKPGRGLKVNSAASFSRNSRAVATAAGPSSCRQTL
jgi:hypothetical protein